MPEDQKPNPPLDPPSIVIGDRRLTLKYSLLADYVLDKRGIDTTQIVPILRRNTTGTKSLVIELFAACVAHNYVEAGEPVPTPEQWCLRIGAEQLTEVGGKLMRALFPNLPAPAETGAPKEDPPKTVQ